MREYKIYLSSSLRLLISSSSSRWIQVPSDLIFSKCCFTSSRHSAWWEHISVNKLCRARAELTHTDLFSAAETSDYLLWIWPFLFDVYSVIQMGNETRHHTWDLKYVSCGVDSTSADAMSRWRRIWRKEGRFLGLQFLQIRGETAVYIYNSL